MDKYLLEILKDNNTIIIPGLGALTVTNKETGETMFMPYLQHDDGKLAKFIAENDGIDEVDAKNMVAKYVREIKAVLDKGESYSMFKLGTFVKKDDGDIEFKNWSKSNVKEETVVPAAPITEEVIEDEPTVDSVPETEAIVEREALPESEVVPEVKPDPVVDDKPEVISEPDPIIESEPEIEPEPEIIPAPVAEPEVTATPEPVVVPEEEMEIRETLVEAINSAPEMDEIIPDKTTLEPSPLLDDIAPTAAVALDPEMESPIENEADGESEEEEEKKKAGVGFWITIIVVALGIIAGGAYVGRNYNDLKQHIPFLADNDEEEEKNSLKDEISNVIKEDKYSAKPEKDNQPEGNSDSSQEGFTDDGVGTDQESSETNQVTTPPEPEVKTPEVKKPAPVTISASSGGPFKVIAGAFSSEANAKKLASEFKAKGMNSEVFLKGELHAVSIQSYATSEAANADLSKLRSMAPGAWIYYKR